MQQRTLLALLLAAGALAFVHIYGAQVRATLVACQQHEERSAADAASIARLKQSVASGERRVLEMARCYRSCLFMCSKPGVLGKKDEVKRCATGCVTQCETLAGVSETQLANLG
eukprot:COSAG04_NODE_247_length_18901_cov_4.971014_12_plen_114_part_00